MASADIWRAAEGPFRLKLWDGEIVVYNEHSGDTHCLDSIASALLMRLVQGGPETAANLREALDGVFEAEDKDHAQAIIDDALETLRVLHLLRSPAS